jgi:hypothetical protein
VCMQAILAHVSIIIYNISFKVYSRGYWESTSGVCPEGIKITGARLVISQ